MKSERGGENQERESVKLIIVVECYELKSVAVTGNLMCL